MTDKGRRTGLSLCVNLLFALYHGVLGVLTRSRWLLAMGGYYTVLAATRAAVLLCARRGTDEETSLFVVRVTGGLLVILGVAMAAVNALSISGSIAKQYQQIVMISLATYTFSKVTLTVVRAVGQRKDPSSLRAAVRCIGHGEAAASVLTLQRSMLVSFGEMPARTVRLMNALTGAGVFLFVILLGIFMMKGRIPVARSKLVQAYQKIENAVVEGYQKVEDTVVDGYTKVEDAFVDRYLTREGESVAQAKERLKNQ